MAEAYIIDAVRTPRGVGKPGKGALSHLHPQHLAATVLKAIKDRNNLDTSTVDDIIWSTSTQKGKQGGDLGRMAALAAGYDISASGTTLDRFCGGGITSVNLAARYRDVGHGRLRDCRWHRNDELHRPDGAEEANAGIKPLGMGSGNMALDAMHPQSHQGVCGDAIAAMEGITREALDALALVSQERADARSRKAASTSRWSPSIMKTAPLRSDREEFPRPETTAEGLASLEAKLRRNGRLRSWRRHHLPQADQPPLSGPEDRRAFSSCRQQLGRGRWCSALLITSARNMPTSMA
jgi:acetyl-CoA C-acetyltransferase